MKRYAVRCRPLTTVNGYHSLEQAYYQLGLVIFCSDLNSGERGININISQVKREEVLHSEEKVAKF